MEFETIAARGKGEKTPVEPKPTPQSARAGMDVFISERKEQKHEPMPLPIFALIAVTASLTTFYFAGGHTLFGSRPSQELASAQPAVQPPQPGAQTGITIGDVTTRVDTSSGRAVLVIRATITNNTDRPGAVPTVEVGFKDPQNGQEMLHRVPRGEILAPAERMAFTTRILAGNYAGTEPRVSLISAR